MSTSATQALPTTMRAVTQREFGTDVLRVDEIPVPQAPGAGEVLLQAAAAGLDRGTWHLMTGEPRIARVAIGWRRPRNLVPGLDVAGTVVAVGPDVTRVAVGDRVFGIARGSFAPYALALADKLVVAPDSLTDPEAAVLGISGLTALQALRDAGRLESGQHVLILGASGGVGSYAVQIAKALGAEVTGVCSADKAELVRSLGADHVLDYRTVDPVDGTTRYDLIIDIAGHRRLSALRRALTPTGTLVIVGSETGGKWTGGLGRGFRAMLLSPFVRQRLTMFVSSENAADLQVLADMATAEELHPPVDSVVPLADAPDAMRRLAAGEVRGKVAISIA